MKRVKITIIFLLLSFFFIALYLKIQQNYATEKESLVKEDTSLVEDYPIININDLREKYNNTDIVGVLKIPDISIETTVVKTNNNTYYLNHSITKKNSSLGTEFVDYRNSSNLASDKQINIYGHNSSNNKYKSSLPFHNLEKLTNEDTFNNLGLIYLYIDNYTLIYQAVAVKVITTDYEYTRLNLSNDNVLKEHNDNLVNNTMYCKNDCNIPLESDVLILQTCYYWPKDSYLLLIAKKTNTFTNLNN